MRSLNPVYDTRARLQPENIEEQHVREQLMDEDYLPRRRRVKDRSVPNKPRGVLYSPTRVREAIKTYAVPAVFINIQESGLYDITSQNAQYILDYWNYKHQRSMIDNESSPRLISMYKMSFVEDKFLTSTQIMFGRLPDGSLHMIDGQRRMMALKLSQAHFPNGPVRHWPFTVTIIECKNEQALAYAYTLIDTVNNSRRNADFFDADLVASGDERTRALLKTINFSMRNAALTAVPILENGMWSTHSSRVPEEISTRASKMKYLFDDNWWLRIWEFHNILQEAKVSLALRRRLTNPMTLAFAILTLRYQPQLAKLFWTRVAKNSGLNRSEPEYTLVQKLTVEEKGNINRNDLRVWLTRAWNAHFHGKTIDRFKWGKDCRIAGIPPECEAPTPARKKSKKEDEE